MDSDNPTLKWSLAAVGVVVVCFCLGYFVFASKGPLVANDTPPTPLASPSPAPSNLPLTVVENQGLDVTDVTAEKEAARKRKEEEALKKKEEEARAAAAALAEPTPAPEEIVVDSSPSPEPDISTDSTEKTPPTPVPTEKPANGDPKEPKDASAKSLFRVRVGGSFRTHEEAEKTSELLRGRGYAAVIKADLRGGKKVYHVQVGAYSDSKSAERTKTEMENNGFDASIH